MVPPLFLVHRGVPAPPPRPRPAEASTALVATLRAAANLARTRGTPAQHVRPETHVQSVGAEAGARFVGAVVALHASNENVEARVDPRNGLTMSPEVRRVNDLTRWERSKLEKLTELQSRTIDGLGMLLATPAPPEAKIAEADALVRHYRELKDALIEPGTGTRDGTGG